MYIRAANFVHYFVAQIIKIRGFRCDIKLLTKVQNKNITQTSLEYATDR